MERVKKIAKRWWPNALITAISAAAIVNSESEIVVKSAKVLLILGNMNLAIRAVWELGERYLSKK